MKRIAIAVLLITLALAGPAAAAPFIVCDEYPAEQAVLWFVTTFADGYEHVVDYGQRPRDKSLVVVLDFADPAVQAHLTPGENRVEIRAENIAGRSGALPFVFTKPSAAPPSPTNTGLSP